MNEDDVAEYFGFRGMYPRKTFKSYETNYREPSKERLNDIAKLYKVSINTIKSKYPSKDKQIGSEKRFFLTRIILTKDDILRYSDEEEDTSFIKLKKPIIIDIYI